MLTQAKDNSYVSLEQEAHSVETTQINLAEGICAVANHLERSISRQDFLTFGRFQQSPRYILLAAEDLQGTKQPERRSPNICRNIMKEHKISKVPVSLNIHLYVSRARALTGGWGGRVLRTSPEQNSENLSPSPESKRCGSFLDSDVKGLP